MRQTNLTLTISDYFDKRFAVKDVSRPPPRETENRCYERTRPTLTIARDYRVRMPLRVGVHFLRIPAIALCAIRQNRI